MLAIALWCAVQPRAAHGQGALDVQVGRWMVSGPDAALYSAGVWDRLWGPLGYGVRGHAVVDPGGSAGSLYGLGSELSLLRGARALVPYGVGGLSLTLRPTSSPEAVLLWNAGLGLEAAPLGWLGLAVEARYLAEDGGFRGFWDLDSEDRRGWVASARVSLRWGAGAGRRVPPTPTTPPPRAAVPRREASYGLAGRIVETALEAMGEPYRWGGTGEVGGDDGFDCSGLVWYAYTSHGVRIPRVSREQARVGRSIEPDLAALEPGDILLFANGGAAVTHVGLYVGEAAFIHATTSGGVRVGALDGTGDDHDDWWRARWVGARRVLQ